MSIINVIASSSICMELTLKQLSPENLKLIFEAASIAVERIVPIKYEKDGKTQKYWGHVWVKEDGFFWRITPTDDEFIQFSYGFEADGEQNTPEMVLLSASNFFDMFPVHLHYKGKNDNGHQSFEFVYSQIFPNGRVIETDYFVQIFRTFQKLTKKNMHNFNTVINIIKEGGVAI